MKKRVIRILILEFIAIAAFALSACKSTPSSKTPSQIISNTSPYVSISTTSSNTGTSLTSTVTFGTMAALGKTVFENYAASSHGENGQGGSGPALIGSNAALGKYNNAQALLNFISSSMPLEAPGSLSHQDYLEILCYLLVQNNYVSPNSIFNESGLSSITLK